MRGLWVDSDVNEAPGYAEGLQTAHGGFVLDAEDVAGRERGGGWVFGVAEGGGGLLLVDSGREEEDVEERGGAGDCGPAG